MIVRKPPGQPTISIVLFFLKKHSPKNKNMNQALRLDFLLIYSSMPLYSDIFLRNQAIQKAGNSRQNRNSDSDCDFQFSPGCIDSQKFP